MKRSFKMSSNVKNNVIGDWALEGENVLLNIQYFKDISNDYVLAEILNIRGLVIKEQYKGSNIISIAIPKSKIENLVNLPFIKWLELIPEPSIKEDTTGKSIHRSSNLDTQTLGGRNYTGEGIGVLVRDDGIVGPHIDFQGRIDNSNASGSGETHGDGVAGIMAGSGNLDPTKRGMAAGSNVYVVNYSSSFLDTQTTNLIDNGNVQITNSSYGNGCNGGYTSIAQTVDTQTIDKFSLLHVFSAGNSGTSDCGFGAGAGWGNITGGHKQGKNVIATANVFFDGSRPNHSSRGPAYDGRIKPDITAHGQGQQSTDENNTYQSFGGTSGAAPGIAGVSAQLYQLYQEDNLGVLPESGLIKAILLNTANDYGNVGPDFTFGWGLVNGLRAAMLLEEERYLEAQITQGVSNNHTINIPAGTTQVRFMVYWSDPAANAGASAALVNDLDLKVTNPSSTELLPWILDSSPNATTLNTPAVTGVDHLNNMEQVLINNPETGDYIININGFNIPQGPQRYHVVYEIVSEELVLTYPQGGEKMVAGESETIHWDATNITENILIEYSNTNAADWTTIATVNATAKNYTWSIPSNINSGEYLVRVTSGAFTSESENFTIAKLVTGISVSQVCPENLTIIWSALDGATGYDIYMLGDKFMDKIGSSNTLSYTAAITDLNADFWLAVVGKGTNWETRRSVAINKNGGLFNCTLSKDIGVVSVINNYTNIACDGGNNLEVSAQILNSGVDALTNFTISYQLDSNPVVGETYVNTINSGVQEVYTFATPLQISNDGEHSLRVFVTLLGDENGTNNEQTLTFYSQITGSALNISETFTNAFPPDGWVIANPDADGYTWQEATITGSDGLSSKVAFIDSADYINVGREDYMITNVYDLTAVSSMLLKFDLAKAQWSATYNDKLRVEVSTDCGSSYTTVYEKEGLDLSTIPDYVSSEWAPSSSTDWRTETVDLNTFTGQKIKVRFVSVNGYSNSTFIDNIEVSGTVLSTLDQSLNRELIIYPNPVSDKLFIKLIHSQEIKSLKLYSVLGKQINISNALKQDGKEYELATNMLSTGIYILKVETDYKVGFRKIIKE
jgi:hypothetical protein